MRTMERSVEIDADLATRARGKLRRNGWTYGDVLNRALAEIVTARGKPSFMEATSEEGYRYENLRPEVKDALQEADEITNGTRPAKWLSPEDFLKEMHEIANG